MKKKPLLLLIMRISVLQLSLILSLIGSAVAGNGKAQGLLDKKITLNESNVKLENVLNQIEKLANFSFVYKTSLTSSDKTISIRVDNQSLSKVLDDVLAPFNLNYEVSNNYIVIKTIEKADLAITDIIVKGTVTDEQGQPLPGVTIKVKGGAGATSTALDGKYTIHVADVNSILVFSFIGFTSQEVNVSNRAVVDIILKSDTRNLNEVVVIGYGDQLKKKLTNSISSIKASDVNELPVTNLGDALAGKASGVDVTSSFGGQPGTAPNIVIRGLGSLGSDNSPLYVVDGYPLESADQFGTINPADILSIDILKDAASASIYGSRAANGVVIVTTKRGKAGQTKFAFSTYTGIQQLAHKEKLLDSAEYMQFEPLLYKERKSTAVLASPLFTNTDWQDQLFRKALITQVNLSASGGSDVVQYSISGSYLYQDGVEITSGYKKYGLHFNLDAKLSDKLKIGVNIAPNFSVQNAVPNGGNYTGTNDATYGGSGAVPNPIYSALLMPPVIPLILPDGRYGQPNFLTPNPGFQSNIENPVAVLNSISNINSNFQALSNAYLQWSIFKDLTYKLNAGGNIAANRNQTYVSDITPTQTALNASFLNPNPASIYAGEDNYRSLGWLFENTLTYNKTFKKEHHVNVLLLQSAQKFSSSDDKVTGATGTFTTDQIHNPAASAQQLGNVAYDVYTFSSLAARLSYDYKEKYLFSASIRSDGSSKFGADNRYGIFRSISGAWRLAEEPFIQKINWISEFKLRASFGETGNANIGSFTWLNSIQGANYNFGSQGSSAGTRNFGTNPAGYYNPDLTWEKNHQLDLGIEFGVLQDRVYLTADVYRKITSDMIQSKNLLGIVGYASAYNTNTGNLMNKGLELALNTVNIKNKNLRWTTNFNISFNRNKVMDLGGPDNLGYKGAITGWGNAFLLKVGRPIGDIYGFIVDGVLKDAAAVAAAPKLRSGVFSPGDMQMRDVNGDGYIDESDRTVIGNALPQYTAGMTNTIQYKAFDLSFVLTARKGGNIVNGNLRNAFGSPGLNLPQDFYNNMWLSTNPEADVKYPAVTGNSTYTFVNTLTSLVVEDGSYLRMRNVTLGYTFTPQILQKIKLKSLRVYASGQNVFTITKYSGFNPEVSVNGNSVSAPAIDQGVYPATRTFIAGINVGF